MVFRVYSLRMACFLDGVKYAGRVGMASGLAGYVNSFLGWNNKPDPSEITSDDRRLLTKIYDTLNGVLFVDWGRGSLYDRKHDSLYEYFLDMKKLNNTTILQILFGIEQIEERSRHRDTPDVIKITGPSGTTPIIGLIKGNIISPDEAHEPGFQKAPPLQGLINLLFELKNFIRDDLRYKKSNDSEYKFKTFKVKDNKGSTIDVKDVGDTTLATLLLRSSNGPTTPRGSRPAPAPAQASVSSGGRRTKRTKRVKRSKRSKHTRRRKH